MLASTTKLSPLKEAVTSEQRRTSPESGGPDIFTPKSAEKPAAASHFPWITAAAPPPRSLDHPESAGIPAVRGGIRMIP